MSLPYLNNRINQLRLRGTTETLHWPRLTLSKKDREALFWRLCMACFVIALIVFLADAFRNVLLVPLVPLISDLLVWGQRARDERLRIPSRAFQYAPISTIWLFAVLLPAVASLVSIGLWAFCMVAIAGWRIIRLIFLLREHFLDYALESSQISVETRRKWRDGRAAGFRDAVEPGRNLAEVEQKRFDAASLSLALQQFSLWACGAYALLAAVVAGFAYSQFERAPVEALTSTPALIGAILVGLPIAIAVIVTPLKSCLRIADQTLKMIAVWCRSPAAVDDSLLAPWSPRSRFGKTLDREAYLYWNLLFIAMLVLPVFLFYPWYFLDGISIYEDSLLDSYPISGSVWFQRTLHLLGNDGLPLGIRIALVVAAFTMMPLLVGAVWRMALVPAIGAAEDLFEGQSPLERETHIVSALREVRER